VSKEQNHSYDGLRTLEMWTDMKLEVSSTFYFHALFNGNYERGCGFTFNLVDQNENSMFHLDFRLNNKDRYRKLIISSELYENFWFGGFQYDLPDLAPTNTIFLILTEKYYELTINYKKMKSELRINLRRLQDYEKIRMRYYGKCMEIDFDKSYMANGG
jgi:hypothetical protein